MEFKDLQDKELLVELTAEELKELRGGESVDSLVIVGCSRQLCPIGIPAPDPFFPYPDPIFPPLGGFPIGVPAVTF